MKNSNCLNTETFRGLLKSINLTKEAKPNWSQEARREETKGTVRRETLLVRKNRENSVQIRGFCVTNMKLRLSSRMRLVLK